MENKAKVDFRTVIDAFNQAGLFPFKLSRNGANFSRVTLNLADVKWNNNTVDAPGSDGFSRTVEVSSQRHNVTTTVTAVPGATPASTVNITTGAVLGVGDPKVKATIKMPPEFKHQTLEIDLTKDSQTVFLPEDSKDEQQLELPATGSASIRSRNTVYQGYFTAEAQLRGTVIFKTEDGQQTQGGIEELARAADKKGFLPKYFKFHNNSLAWNVNGTADFLLEKVNIVEGN